LFEQRKRPAEPEWWHLTNWSTGRQLRCAPLAPITTGVMRPKILYLEKVLARFVRYRAKWFRE
jgi:hypothetical protein